MCEAAAYVVKNGREERILEAVDILETEGDVIKITNIFGEKIELRGRIRSLSLVEHRIILEPL